MSSTPDPTSTSTIKLKVYIAGPMTGFDNSNFALFFTAEGIIQPWGYDTVNPARMDIADGKAQWNWQARAIVMDNEFTVEEALDRDFKVILDGCIAIFVLPGWEKSQGALRETWLALSTGRRVFKFDPDKPVDIRHQSEYEIKLEDHPYESNRS